MGKKELWRIFMRTGKVSDYLNYKNARDEKKATPFFGDEISEEFAEEFVNNFDSDFPAMEKRDDIEYSDDYGDFTDYDY